MPYENRPLAPLLAFLTLATVAIAGCERVNPELAENASRNDASFRVAQATPPSPSPPAATASTPSLPSLPSRESISDTVITARIKAALIAEPALAGADVSVNTAHGMVVLNGTVKSYEQAGLASAHAQRQDGVMGVDNQLGLTPE